MKTRIFASMLAVCFVFSLCLSSSVHAATVALSINFTDSGHQIGANTAGVGGYGNWNDVFGYPLSTDIPVAGDFTLSNGDAASGIKLQIGTGGQFTGSTSGASAGDTALMTTGIGGYVFPNGQNHVNAVIKFTGLDSVFTNGYSLRLYQIKELNNPNGQMRASVFADEYTYDNGYNGANPNAYHASDTTVNFNANVSPFTGTFTDGAFSEALNVADGGVGHGTLVVTQIYIGGNPNNNFNRGSFAGIQIIGEIAEPPAGTPEPTSAVLALLGVVGMMFTGRRRKRS